MEERGRDGEGYDGEEADDAKGKARRYYLDESLMVSEAAYPRIPLGFNSYLPYSTYQLINPSKDPRDHTNHLFRLLLINNCYYDQHDDLIDIRSSYLFNSVASVDDPDTKDRLQL
uniref:Uncharacterized protein n=1 Tax=Cucumis melo TaxID=3656 RepID=A0A9I9EDM6_CUCME